MSLNDDLQEIIRTHDGDLALLYIYRNVCDRYDRDDACIKLDMTMKQLLRAETLLSESGLRTDGSFRNAEKVSSTCDGGETVLVTADIETVLAFPFDALALYFLYVSLYGSEDIKKAAAHLQRTEDQIQELKKRLDILQLLPDQPAQQPKRSFLDITKSDALQAEDDREPDVDLTPAQPEEVLVTPGSERKQLILDLAGALNIHDRTLTPLERKYIGDWIELGFKDPRSVAIAYERTLTNLGRMKWEYADKIIRSWYAQKLFTPEDILEYDKRHRSTSKKSREREAARAARKNTAKSNRNDEKQGASESDYVFPSKL